MLQQIDDVLQFSAETAGGGGGGGAYNRNIFFCLQVDGPITEAAYMNYNRNFTVLAFQSVNKNS